MQTEIARSGHTHPGDTAAVEAEKAKRDMKTAAKGGRTCPQQIVADALASQPVEVAAAVGRMDSLKRTLRYHKRGTKPTEPSTLEDLAISGEWTTTGGSRPETFLIHDSGPDSTDRVVVYATDDALRHLTQSSEWFMDGTFTTAPKLFEQLYVIRAPLAETSITCVYAFLSGKSQAVYEELFRAINDKCRTLGLDVEPVNVTIDFEQSVFKAIANVYGQNVNVKGCFYHLTQSTWRKVQQLGLTAEYKSDEKVRHFCGMMDGLAFLPLDDVEDGMAYLKAEVVGLPFLLPLLTYFDSTYVSGPCRSVQNASANRPTTRSVLSLRLRRQPPLFPPKIWNVHETTVNSQARTNNICEAWNNGYTAAL